MKKCNGEKVQWHKSAMVQRCNGAKVQGCKGTKMQRHKGAKSQYCACQLWDMASLNHGAHSFLTMGHGSSRLHGIVLNNGAAL